MSEYFPYENLRPNQREFIELIGEAVKNGENAIVEAPTGFGKTISVLAGVLPFAKEYGYKVLYLARTHRQMDRVIEELKAIHRKSPFLASSLGAGRSCAFTPTSNSSPPMHTTPWSSVKT